jgi:hypothetical protein
LFRLAKCEYRFCGKTFEITARIGGSPRRYCTRACAKKEQRATKAIDGKTIKNCGTSSHVINDMSPCKHQGHIGSAMVPKTGFYMWQSESGATRRSTWCKACLKRWIAANDMSDEHGQHPEADDQARLDLYSGSYDTYEIKSRGGSIDAVDVAMRLVTGKAV